KGMAAQFTAMNGPALTRLRAWISLATSSFPVPDSPVIKTFTSVWATRSINANTFFIAVDDPINRPMPPPVSSVRNLAFSARPAYLLRVFDSPPVRAHVASHTELSLRHLQSELKLPFFFPS